MIEEVNSESNGEQKKISMADYLEIVFKKFGLIAPPEDVTDIILIWRTTKNYNVSGSIDDRIVARGMVETAPDILKGHWNNQDMQRMQEMQRNEAMKRMIMNQKP